MDNNYLDEFFAMPVYGVPQDEKKPLFIKTINQLNQHHYTHCKEYCNLIKGMNYSLLAEDYQFQPFLVAGLFKTLALKSVENKNVFKQLNSSGTSSQVLSKIYLDACTAKMQSRALSKIVQEFIGPQRLPMLIIDAPDVVKNKSQFSARGAGINGFFFLGRDHSYVLNNDMTINETVLKRFIDKYQDQKILIFGFTYIIWQYFLSVLKQAGKGRLFNQAIMFHGGGWKKLTDSAISDKHFKQTSYDVCGNIKVHNFYGMVEQTGSIYVECEQGFFHSSVFSEVLIRSTETLACNHEKEKGLIQTMSVLPFSYPGHSLLTEDLGTIFGVDDCPCGRKGSYFKVNGRLPKVETRGCSDTFSLK